VLYRSGCFLAVIAYRDKKVVGHFFYCRFSLRFIGDVAKR
jgi:hypothetical protein